MADFYKLDYSPYTPPKPTDLRPLSLPFHRQLGTSSSHEQPVRILDYGPGAGAWLGCASLTYPHTDLTAVDFDRCALQKRLQWLHEPINLLSPGQFLDQTDTWDIINFAHSLEHIHNPLPVLQKAISLLNPGGSLIIDCPSSASLSLRIWGPFWQGLEAPRHLSIPSRRQIARLLQGHGLKLCRQFTYGSAELFRRTLSHAALHGQCSPKARALGLVGQAVCGQEWMNRVCGRLGLSTAFRIITTKPVGP